jgi:hypothetical protein
VISRLDDESERYSPSVMRGDLSVDHVRGICMMAAMEQQTGGTMQDVDLERERTHTLFVS